jgi:acetyl esterase/lipase
MMAQHRTRSTMAALASAMAVILVLPSTTVAQQEVAQQAGAKIKLLRGVEYAKRGDLRLLADVAMPVAKGAHPAVLLVHGGGWMTGRKEQMGALAERLAKHGYTAVTINYRLAPRHKFPAQIEDCKAALRWMRDNAKKYRIDPLRVAGYGFSAGGHLVALLGTSDKTHGLEGPDAKADGPSTRLQCVVAGGAPCDFRLLPSDVKILAYWLGGTRREKPEAYVKASPATYISKDDPPTFFFHGEKDRIVPKLSPTLMVAAMTAVGVEVELYTVPGASHMRSFFDSTAATKALVFLDKHLKSK